MDKKVLTIIILSGALALTLVWALVVTFKPEPELIDTAFLEKKINDLETENAELHQKIDVRNVNIERRDQEIDSLLSLKPKIRTEYVKIYEEVNTATVIELVDIADSIYTVEGIDH